MTCKRMAMANINSQPSRLVNRFFPLLLLEKALPLFRAYAAAVSGASFLKMEMYFNHFLSSFFKGVIKIESYTLC